MPQKWDTQLWSVLCSRHTRVYVVKALEQSCSCAGCGGEAVSMAAQQPSGNPHLWGTSCSLHTGVCCGSLGAASAQLLAWVQALVPSSCAIHDPEDVV